MLRDATDTTTLAESGQVLVAGANTNDVSLPLTNAGVGENPSISQWQGNVIRVCAGR